MKQLEHLCLISELPKGATIRIPIEMTPANKTIKPKVSGYSVILDTGADNTTLSQEYLKIHGYGKYHRSGKHIQTATGLHEILACDIKGIKIANAFYFEGIQIGVFEQWDSSKVVGVIGMDILSQLTFLMSHEAGQFLLTDEKMPELTRLFNKLTPSSVFNKRK